MSELKIYGELEMSMLSGEFFSSPKSWGLVSIMELFFSSWTGGSVGVFPRDRFSWDVLLSLVEWERLFDRRLPERERLRSRERDRFLSLDRDLFLSLDLDFLRSRDRDLFLSRERDRFLSLERDLFLSLERDRLRERERFLRDRDLDRRLDRDRFLSRERDRSRFLDGDRSFSLSLSFSLSSAGVEAFDFVSTMEPFPLVSTSGLVTWSSTSFSGVLDLSFLSFSLESFLSLSLSFSFSLSLSLRSRERSRERSRSRLEREVRWRERERDLRELRWRERDLKIKIEKSLNTSLLKYQLL